MGTHPPRRWPPAPATSSPVNITTILGLGIDYELFMVTRFREELHRQPTVEQAVARTVATAGRTVAVSGVTVALALTSLMLFPETFLRSMGYGGVATVAVDMLAALTALRIRRSLPFSITGHRAPREETSGGWGVHAVEGLDGGNVTHKVWRIASRARSPRVNVNVTNKVHPNRPEMAGVAGGVP